MNGCREHVGPSPWPPYVDFCGRDVAFGSNRCMLHAPANVVEDCARRYVAAAFALEAFPSGHALIDAHVHYDAARHDLIVACGFECTTCEAGTCPGVIG